MPNCPLCKRELVMDVNGGHTRTEYWCFSCSRRFTLTVLYNLYMMKKQGATKQDMIEKLQKKEGMGWATRI